MFTQFPKKTLFSKLISGIVAVSFILTSVPVRSYAAQGAADNLRPKQGKREKTLGDVARDLEKVEGNSPETNAEYLKGHTATASVALLPNKQKILGKLRNPNPPGTYEVVISDSSSDTDTVVSAIAEAYRIKNVAMGFSAPNVFPVIQGKLNDETLFILKEAGINPADLIFIAEDNVEDLLTTLAKKTDYFNITLTDHSNLIGKKENLPILNERVIRVIDHHPISDKIKPAEAIYEKVGSTNTLIFERFLKYEVPIPKNVALLMFSAILSDTKNLVVNATERDKKAVEELKNILGYSEQSQKDLFIRQTHALNTIEVQNPLEKIFNPDNLRYFPNAQKPEYSFTTFRLDHNEKTLFNELWPAIVNYIQTDIRNRNLDVAFFNLTHLNEQGGLNEAIPEELYVIGTKDNVFKYMKATGIPYQDKIEELSIKFEDIGVYKLEHKGKAPRKKIVEKITGYFNAKFNFNIAETKFYTAFAGAEYDNFMEAIKDIKEGIGLAIGANVFENPDTLPALRKIKEANKSVIKIAIWAKDEAAVNKLKTIGVEEIADFITSEGLDDALYMLTTKDIGDANIVLINSQVDLENLKIKLTLEGKAISFDPLLSYPMIKAIKVETPTVTETEASINAMTLVLARALAGVFRDNPELVNQYKQLSQTFSDKVSETDLKTLNDLNLQVINIPLIKTTSKEIIEAYNKYKTAVKEVEKAD